MGKNSKRKREREANRKLGEKKKAARIEENRAAFQEKAAHLRERIEMLKAENASKKKILEMEKALATAVRHANDDEFLNRRMSNPNKTITERRFQKQKKSERRKRREKAGTTIQQYIIEDDPSHFKNDEDYVEESAREKKKAKRNRRRRTANTAMVDDGDVDTSEMGLENHDGRWVWVKELQALDDSHDFNSEYLVILEKQADDTYYAESFAGLKIFSPHAIVIRRCSFGQDYIFQSFRRYVHFALGPKGFEKFCSKFKVQIYTGKNTEDLPAQLHFLVSMNEHGLPLQNVPEAVLSFREQVSKCCSILLPSLLKKPKSNNERIAISLDLGLTDNRCSGYTAWNILGQTVPNLISLDPCLSKNCIDAIRETCECFSTKVVPSFPILQEAFTYDKELDAFALQLGSTLQESFLVPSVSIILPSSSLLSPHVDGKNAMHKDLTYQCNVSINIASLSKEAKVNAKKLYGNAKSIKCTLLIYTRRCVERSVEQRDRAINFQNQESKSGQSEPGRKLLHEILCDMENDLSFNKLSYDNWAKKVKPLENIALEKKWKRFHFEGDGVVREELAHKTSWWSPVLHCFFSFALQNSISKIEAIEFCLFFAHQVASTPIICQCMDTILQNPQMHFKQFRNKGKSFYQILSRMCMKLKGLDKEVDVGVAGGARFSSSNCEVYTEQEVFKYVTTLSERIKVWSKTMAKLKSKENSTNGIMERLTIVHKCIQDFEQILPGVGAVKGMHLVQLLALIGIFDLQFFVYTPLHWSGGPQKFLMNEMSFKQEPKIEELLLYNAELVSEAKKAYNNEFTPEILEQMSCMIGRKDLKYDFHLCLSRVRGARLIQGATQLKNYTVSAPEFQCIFRVRGNSTHQWTLEMFNGTSRQAIHSAKDPKKSCIYWTDKHLVFNKIIQM